MKLIKLYGFLADRFGAEHHRDVKDAAEAIRALCATLDGFEEIIAKEKEYGFSVFVAEKNIGIDEFHAPMNEVEVIKIVPVLFAAKDDFTKIIVGIIMIVVTYYTFGTGGSIMISAEADAAVASTMYAMGGAMVMGGIANMLAPSPDSVQGSIGNQAEHPTYVFSGPTNTAAQGAAIPVLYGRLRIGSIVISAGIDSNSFYKGHGASDEVGTMSGDGDGKPWICAIAPVVGA